jgi:hypothetical protein
MLPNPRNRGYEADQHERENEAKLGQLHNRISNLKNVSPPDRNLPCSSTCPTVRRGCASRSRCGQPTAPLVRWFAFNSGANRPEDPQITIAIGDEVRDQNRALDMMGGGFGDTDNLIGSTMKKMQVRA